MKQSKNNTYTVTDFHRSLPSGKTLKRRNVNENLGYYTENNTFVTKSTSKVKKWLKDGWLKIKEE